MKTNLHSVALAVVLAAASLSSLAEPLAVEPGTVSADLQRLPSVNAPTSLGETVRVAINPQPLPPRAPPREDRTHSMASDLRLAGGPPTVIDIWVRLRRMG